MATIADYRASVRTMIRDTNNASYAFLDSEIDSFTQAAVLTYTLYRPRRRPYTLTMQTGVSTYQLPNDWLQADMEAFNESIQPPSPVDIMEFASFVLPNISNAPLLNDMQYEWYDMDQSLVVTPTPSGTMTINFAYYAMHNVDANGSTIPTMDFDAIVLGASSRALDALAINKGLQMQKYKIGQGLQIDDSEIAKRLQEQAKTYEARFEQLVRFRPFGVSG